MATPFITSSGQDKKFVVNPDAGVHASAFSCSAHSNPSSYTHTPPPPRRSIVHAVRTLSSLKGPGKRSLSTQAADVSLPFAFPALPDAHAACAASQILYCFIVSYRWRELRESGYVCMRSCGQTGCRIFLPCVARLQASLIKKTTRGRALNDDAQPVRTVQWRCWLCAGVHARVRAGCSTRWGGSADTCALSFGSVAGV